MFSLQTNQFPFVAIHVVNYHLRLLTSLNYDMDYDSIDMIINLEYLYSLFPLFVFQLVHENGAKQLKF